MPRRAGGFVVAAITAVLVLFLAPAALAHPLGNFTINTYSSLVAEPGRVEIGYVLDMAEIPTQQAMPSIDPDGKSPTDAERSAWAQATASQLVGSVSLEAGGANVPLHVASARMMFRPGQAGLPILRLVATFEGAVPRSASIAYSDSNYSDHIGWREITVLGASGEAISGSDVPTQSISSGLCTYPTQLLQSPLRTTSASFDVAPGSSGAAPPLPGGCGAAALSAPRPGVTGGSFADLVNRQGAALMALALLLAALFGGFHALAPGHGKSVTAAYLVGAGGRTRQAALAGGIVALMHTTSVLGLGLLVLSAERIFPPERIYPWLGLFSGIVVASLGAYLVVTRLRVVRHAGAHASTHSHEHAHEHSHAVLDPSKPLLSKRGLTALALSGGILPSPTALVVLLASIALHRVVFGLALILAFSAGLAGALIGVAVAAIRARDVLSRRMGSRIGRLIPVTSASAVVVAGAVLVARAAVQI